MSTELSLIRTMLIKITKTVYWSRVYFGDNSLIVSAHHCQHVFAQKELGWVANGDLCELHVWVSITSVIASRVNWTLLHSEMFNSCCHVVVNEPLTQSADAVDWDKENAAGPVQLIQIMPCYTMCSEKNTHLYFYDNFGKSGPIFIIISLLNWERICRESWN